MSASLLLTAAAKLESLYQDCLLTSQAKNTMPCARLDCEALHYCRHR